MSFDILLIIGGLVLLVAGGELLTSGASRLAVNWGVKPIIIGLTVVAFGTSMPEAFVSIFAALENKSDIAVANVIGSNIFNLLFILGVSAVIRPLKVERTSTRREIPFLIGMAILVWMLGLDGVIGRLDGCILLSLFVTFLIVCIRSESNEETSSEMAMNIPLSSHFRSIGLIVGSLVLLVVGAKLLLNGSVSIARNMGISELIIGLTIVAAGTSLPELATSIMASFRGKDDIAVGNVTGSNIFNVGFILGSAAVFHPLTVSQAMLNRDVVIMVAASLLALPILRSGFKVSRLEGAVLLIAYIIYTIYVVNS